MIIDAIIRKLNNYFPNMDIYGDEIKQGFNEPCFFIQQLSRPRKKEIQSYQNTENFDIQHFLDDDEDDKNKQYMEMGEDLLNKLEYIELDCGRKIRGTQMSYEIRDGVLHVYITYIYYSRVVDSVDKMENIDVEGMIKNG